MIRFRLAAWKPKQLTEWGGDQGKGGEAIGPTHRDCQKHQGESEIITEPRQMYNLSTKPKGMVGERSRSKASGLKLETPEQSERILEAGVGHGESSLRSSLSTGLNNEKELER